MRNRGGSSGRRLSSDAAKEGSTSSIEERAQRAGVKQQVCAERGKKWVRSSRKKVVSQEG
jgi:hypothetical protein